MEAGLDAAVQIRTILAEALMTDYVAGRSGTLQPDFLPIKGVTDCKSLYDFLCKEGAPSTTMERRLAVDVAAISEIGEEFDPENPARLSSGSPLTCGGQTTSPSSRTRPSSARSSPQDSSRSEARSRHFRELPQLCDRAIRLVCGALRHV